MSLHGRKLASLTVLHSIVKSFERGEKPLSARNITEQYHAPINLTDKVIEELLESKLVVETMNGKEKAYVPATDINKIDIDFVLSALNDHGAGDIRIGKSEPMASFIKKLETIRKDRKSSRANVMLKDISEG